MARKSSKKKDKWIQGAIKHPGSFTAWCKKQGFSHATEACIKKGEKSSNPTIRKRATLAKTLKGLAKKKKK